MFSKNSVKSQRILYTPSAFAKSVLCYLQEIGTLKALKPHTSTRSNLSSYLFFIVLEGSGTLTYCGKTTELSVGDCVFIDCMKAYSHSTSDNLWKLQWVHFNSETMSGIYRKYTDRGGQPVFHARDVNIYTNLLDNIYTHSTSNDYIRDMKINETIYSLLTEIMKMSWRPENQHKNMYKQYSIHDIKEFLDENWSKKIVLGELADKFFINKFYLTRLFKNQYGISVINYILDLKITHAKRLLRFTDNTAENIALTCGFSDANYFSRAFKKIEGVSPIEYRRMWVQ